MLIDYEKKSKKFVIDCSPEENNLVMGLPDRSYRKVSRKWGAPALRRNLEYMSKHMGNKDFYTPCAWAVFNDRVEEVHKPLSKSLFPSWYPFILPPRKYQSRGLDKWFGMNEAGIFYEQGMGKTFTSISLATAWRMTDQIDAVLVLCPSSIKLVWADELAKHCPLPYTKHAVEAGKNKQVEKFISEKADFPWLVMGIEGLSQGTSKDMAKLFASTRRVAVILDESSKIKTPGKIRTDEAIKIGELAKKRVILSGTSVTQGLEDLWTQMRFLNPDITGCHSFFTYRARYCQVVPIEVAPDRWVQKIIGYKNEDELMGLIQPYVDRVEKKDVTDLPEKIFTTRLVTMNPAQRKMYKSMFQESFIDYGNDEGYEVATVLERMLRLQQITGGFCPVDDGEKMVPVPIKGKNPKIAELLSILDEIPGKVVIWCVFRSEVALVAESMKKAEIPFVEFHGGCDDLMKQYAVKEFREGESKVFLATRAAAYGLTLVESSNAIYYSQDYSLEIYSQSQDRIHRIGQKDSCNYIHLCAEGTVDLAVIQALASKKNVADLVYSMLKDN